MELRGQDGRTRRLPRPLLPRTALEFARLRHSESWPIERLRGEQVARLEASWHTAKRAPFWDTHLAGSSVPRTVEDLGSLPTVDKAMLRAVADRERLTADASESRRVIRTSGTTGESFSVPYSRWGAWYQGVLQLRQASHRSLRFWERRLSVDVFPLEARSSRLPRLTRTGRLCVDPIDVSAAAQELLVADPDVIVGPAHLLIEVGDAMRDRRLRPRAVGTRGETLTPEHRAAVKAMFGVDPMDAYGTSECGMVAWQCKAADLYHVNHESVIVEIIRSDGEPAPQGEMGELVLTSLWNELTPFIRYRIGDSAVWASRECRCGYAQPAIAQIVGRTPDWLIDAKGERVSPSRLWLSVHLGVDALPRVRRYCVRQALDGHVVVEIVPGQGFAEEDGRRLQESYQDVLGDVGIDVRLVDAITVGAGRKFETISSEAGRASEARTQ